MQLCNDSKYIEHDLGNKLMHNRVVIFSRQQMT